MNQQINSKVIIGVIVAIIAVLGVVIYRSATAPATAPVAGMKKTTVPPPSLPSEDDLKKMREARNAH